MELDAVCAKMQSGRPLSPAETSRVLVLLAQNEQAHEFRKAMVSGDAYSRNPSAKLIQKHVVVGAVKAMTPTEQGMLAQVMSMAKSGNRNAVKALKALRAQGLSATMGQAGLSAKVPGLPMTPAEQQKLAAVVALAKQGNTNAQAAVAKLVQQGYTVSMGSFVGWGIEDAFKLALKPVTIPLQYAWKGRRRGEARLGITSSGTSPQQARIQRLKAAQARIRAAKAKARAADAQSEAEYRAQQQLAAAADAEADAADADATAKEAAIQTEEAQFLPGQTEEEADAAAAASSAMGAAAYSNFGVKPTVTPLPATPATKSPAQAAKDAELERLMKASYNSKKSLRRPPGHHREARPEGCEDPRRELREDAYRDEAPGFHEALRGSREAWVEERRAVAVMVAKAKKGDKQALADVQALEARGDRRQGGSQGRQASRAHRQAPRPRREDRRRPQEGGGPRREPAHPSVARPQARQGGQARRRRRPATRRPRRSSPSTRPWPRRATSSRPRWSRPSPWSGTCAPRPRTAARSGTSASPTGKSRESPAATRRRCARRGSSQPPPSTATPTPSAP